MKKKFFSKYLDAKKYAKQVGGKTRPVFKIGIRGGKTHIGYNVEY